MTLKYESEILFDLMKRDGDDTPSDVLPYESELKEKYLKQVEGAYPKLQDYRSEWLNYNLEAGLPADFPVETLSNVTRATVDNVVPYAYGSAILKGNTLVNLCDKTKDVFSSSGNKNLWQNVLSITNPSQLTIINYTDKVIKYSVNNRTTDAWVSTNKVNPNSKLLVNCGTDNYLKDLYGAYGDGWSNTKEDMDILKNGVLILEGDHTQEDIPYFEGMQSVQMPVLTTTSEDGSKTIILTVNEDVTLRGIGEVKDELDLLTGEVTERIGEIVLDGSENWQNQSDSNWNSDTHISFRFKLNNMAVNVWNSWKINCISDKFTTKLLTNDSYVLDEEFIGSDGTAINGMNFNIKILRSRLNGNETVDRFKQWLSQNPITVQYELAQESIKTVDLTITNQNGESLPKMKPIEGTMHIHSDGTPLKPTITMEIPVEATTQNLASFIKEE